MANLVENFIRQAIVSVSLNNRNKTHSIGTGITVADTPKGHAMRWRTGVGESNNFIGSDW